MLNNAIDLETHRQTTMPASNGKVRRQEVNKESGEVTTALNSCLAHLIDLKMRAKRAHWNAKGGSFYALHKMFDAMSLELEALADEVGERVMAVGGVAAGNAFEVSSRSILRKTALGSTRADDVLIALKSDYDTARTEARRAFEVLVKAEDEPSMDIIIGAMKLLDKQRSFLRAQLGE